MPVAVAEWSKAWTVLPRLDAGLGSNPTRNMDVYMYVYVYSMFVLSYVGRGLAMSWSLIKGVLPCVSKCLNRFRNPIGRPRPDSGLLRHRGKKTNQYKLTKKLRAYLIRKCLLPFSSLYFFRLVPKNLGRHIIILICYGYANRDHIWGKDCAID
jgi:hypothetical protein